jgi:HD-GYP domain-containing protein (c-di-GMP phosphodiesterase class II)
MADTDPAWKQTWLWKTLEERKGAKGNGHADSISRTVNDWMDEMVPVLAAGGTSPKDFTLHDTGHSLRVAGRIADLVPDTVTLSDYELGLLLLAAFGHDIGMTPARGKVRDHYRFLFSNDTGLTDPEKS